MRSRRGSSAEAEAREAAEAEAAEALIKELEAELQRLRAQSKGGPPNPAAP